MRQKQKQRRAVVVVRWQARVVDVSKAGRKNGKGEIPVVRTVRTATKKAEAITLHGVCRGGGATEAVSNRVDLMLGG